MILDSLLQIATAYAPTAVATNVSGTILDLGSQQDLGMGEGRDIYGFVSINTTVTGNATATLQFIIQGSIDAVFTTPLAIITAPPTAILQANFATQALKGTQFKYKVPRGFPCRYLRLAVVIGTATLTAGAFDCWIGPEAATDNLTYPGNYTV